MKSVGEAMAIGRSFAKSVQKALRSMETGLDGFDEVAIAGVEGAAPEDSRQRSRRRWPARPRPAAGDRAGLPARAHDRRDPRRLPLRTWFLERIREIVEAEEQVRRDGLPDDATALLRLKQMGFSDARLGPPRRHRGGRGRGVAAPARRAPGLQAHRHLRRRVPVADPVYVFLLRGRRLRSAGMRGRSERARQGRDPRRRPEPHRPGDRVRLLLRPCRLQPARGRASRRSWSTATRRPSRPITTPPTGSISSR